MSSRQEEDLFDSVVFFEEKCQKQGYEDGFNKGKVEGLREGYLTGLAQGKLIGNEVGFYQGFVQTWLASCYVNERNKIKIKLEALLKLLQQDWSDTSRDLIPELERIRAKFKQICSMLNINVEHTGKDAGKQLSF